MSKYRGRLLAVIMAAAMAMTAMPVSGLAAESAGEASAEAGSAGSTSVSADSADDEAVWADSSEEAASTDGGAEAVSADQSEDKSGAEETEDACEAEEAGEAEEAADEAVTAGEDTEAGADTEALDEAVSADGSEEAVSEDVSSDGDAVTADGAEDAGETEDAADAADAAAAAPEDEADAADTSDEEAVIEEETASIDMSFGDSEELFEQYFDILSRDGEDQLSKARRKNAAENLSGNDRIIYWKLRNAAAEVAKGARTSTVVTVSIKDLGADPNKLYTAKEIGVSKLLSGGEITDAAQSKMTSKVNFNINKIVYALKVDCPSEFYWGDGDMSYTSSVGIRANSEYIWFTTKSLTFSLKVNAYYGSDTYKANTARTGAAYKALNTANTIVSDAAGLTDREKLAYYVRQILGLSDYHTTATGNTELYNKDFNPWQMIYVFDGDPSTKVVCAGYARAFKYLCDKTSFRNNTVSAIYVEGTCNMEPGGTGMHAWNVVHMDDGRNYMVDVTNSSADAIGKDGSLFLKGPVSGDYDGEYAFATPSGLVYYGYTSAMLASYNKAELLLTPLDYGQTGHTHSYGAWQLTRAATPYAKGIRMKVCGCGDVILQDVDCLTVSNTKVTGIKEKVYTGKAQKQTVKVTYNGKTLKLGTDYTVTYKNNKNVGKASVLIKGKGLYGGVVTKTFVIRPRMTKLTKLTAGKKRFTAKWAKRKVQSTGYQIQYALNKKFTKAKSAFVGKSNQISRVITGLGKGKIYYVRVRTYKKVGSKRYYSSWSKARTVRTK